MGKFWTFISDMNGSNSIIDYILINKKWKNSKKSIHNPEAYNFDSHCGSDHRVVVAKLRLSLRKRQSPAHKVKNVTPSPFIINLMPYELKEKP